MSADKRTYAFARKSAPEPTKSQTLRACQYFLGPDARIWFEAGEYLIGIDKKPGREVLGRGLTLIAVFEDTFLDAAKVAQAQAKQEQMIAAAQANVESAAPDSSTGSPE